MTVRIRHRTNPNKSLPNFAAGCKFQSQNARFDKVDISIELGQIAGDIDRANRAFKTISRSSLLFNHRGKDFNPALKIKIRNSPWIIRGEVRAHRSGDNTTCLIKAYLTINPTRYFAHNTPSRRRRNSPYGRAYKLTVNASAQTAIKKLAIYGSDNLIIDTRFQEARNTDWPSLIREIVENITTAIKDEFSNLIATQTYRPLPIKWTLQSLECYWEYKIDNALCVSADFCAFAADHFRRHRQKFYHSETDYNGSAVSYIFDTKHNDVKVAVYAKTVDRIRIECRFTRYPRQIYPRALSDAHYPSTDMDSLCGMASALVNKAQNVLMPLKNIQTKYLKNEPSPTTAVVTQLAGLAQVALTHRIGLSRVITNLLIAGRVSESTDRSHNEALLELQQRGMLTPYRKRSRQPREYRPVGAFKRLVESLQRNSYNK